MSIRWRWPWDWRPRASAPIRSKSDGIRQPMTRRGFLPIRPARPCLHYHQEVEPNGMIRPVGNASIDGQIEMANAAVQRIWVKADP